MVMDRCCCGCSLKLGTILVGLYYLAVYIPGLVILVECGQDEEFMQEIYRLSSSDDEGRMKKEEMEIVGEIIYELLLWTCVACLILNVFLIAGAATGVWFFFIPWLIVHIFSLGVLVLFVLCNLWAKIGEIKIRAITVGAMVIHTQLTVYYIVVVFGCTREFYTKGKLKKHGGVILSNADNDPHHDISHLVLFRSVRKKRM